MDKDVLRKVLFRTSGMSGKHNSFYVSCKPKKGQRKEKQIKINLIIPDKP